MYVEVQIIGKTLIVYGGGHWCHCFTDIVQVAQTSIVKDQNKEDYSHSEDIHLRDHPEEKNR